MWSVFFVFLSYLDRNFVKCDFLRHSMDAEKDDIFYMLNSTFCTKMSRMGDNYIHQVSDGTEEVRLVYDPVGNLVDCSVTGNHIQVKSFMYVCRLGFREQRVQPGYSVMSLADMAEAESNCRAFRVRSQLTRKTIKAKTAPRPQTPGEERKEENPASEETSKVMHRSKRGFTYPGTLWCGAGNIADHYEHLGEFAETDSCCRVHDHCPYVIHPFSSKFGYTNFKWHSICHCDCDNALKDCLRKVNDTSSRVVGQAFFNVIEVPCFEFAYEEQCVERHWYGVCKKYDTVPVAVTKESKHYDFGGIDVIDKLTIAPRVEKEPNREQEGQREGTTQPTPPSSQTSVPEEPSLSNVVTAAEDFIKEINPRKRNNSKMSAPRKQYGLILKTAASKSAALLRPSVFQDDSDDELSVGESLQKEAVKKKIMKQTRLEMQKALEEDSSVYEYDNVYDDIQKKKEESSKRLLGTENRKPKYITHLLHAVEERKKEQERRDERKIQKEREMEGEEFKDKDAFVTSAYRQKLLERQEEEEKLKKEAALEAALDVTKQKDLSGFYRHLLNQTVGEERPTEPAAARELPADCTPASDRAPSLSPSRDPDVSIKPDRDQRPASSSAHSKRQYRQRSPSVDKEEEEEMERDRHREKRHKDRGREERGHHSRKDEKERRAEKEDEEDRNRGRRKREETHAPKDRRDEERERDRKHGRDRERDGDRERKRGRGNDEERNREREKGKEGDRQTDKTTQAEENPSCEEGKDGTKDVPASEPSKFAKRSSDQTVNSARDRFLARQIARSAAKSYIEKEED
ncbi:hypothetical protein AAFF_G00089030 [Aldrovandia affinis]|uniref:Nuclear speckle splicing regulatory protein 1 n=1 Tax=Aldrovandia affinis TaxID=143900 RepID=A0AAD7RW77_9TELE|nr:hypothetical protein AAFF_G00089030 [Aldrovandia affinis]